jgi:hypothetical protein
VLLSRRAWPATAAPARRMIRTAGIVAVSYLGLVGASRLLADGHIPLDDRLLSPLMLLGTLVLGVLCAAFWSDARVDGVRRMLVVGVVASWCWGASEIGRWWWNIYTEDGGDFASREWALSPTLAPLDTIPAGVPLYTNWPAAIWFHTGRPSRFLPPGPDSLQAKRWGEQVTRSGGVVLVFQATGPDVLQQDVILRRSGLARIASYADGAIWGASGAQGTPGAR